MSENGVDGQNNNFDDNVDSPNIESDSDTPNISDAPEESTANPNEIVTIDGIPIAEEDIKFRAKDIQTKDDSKLFVKIEGAKRYAREKERIAKKKDEDLKKRLLGSAKERKKEQRKIESEKRATKRKETIAVHRSRLQKFGQFFWRFKFIFIPLILIIIAIPIGFYINAEIQAKLERDRVAAEKTADNKTVIENRTPMLELYAQLAGKELKKAEVQKLVKEADKDITVDFYDSDKEGWIVHKNGGTELIRFTIEKRKKETFAFGFGYLNNLDSGTINLSGGNQGYYFSHDGALEEFDDVDELINECILYIAKQKE